MKPIWLLPVLLFFSLQTLQASPKREIRAVWLATNYGLDWPQRPIKNLSDLREQQDKLDRILDRFQEANFNVVFLQVRLRGDVIYPSGIEPYSAWFKSQNVLPESDMVAYAIEACRRRGLEFHAWFVTYPIGGKRRKSRLDNNGRKLVRKHDGKLYLDPGEPETSSYLLRMIRELVSRYDLDGFHFDYIRYPDKPAAFPDHDSYKRYGSGKDKASWRRENINRFVYAAYDTIKALKPWVQVSSSVVGMYRKIPGASSAHWTAYQDVYQDPVDWLAKGKHDLIVPMMYYSGKLFFPFVDDWLSLRHDRLVVPGLGLYMMDEKEMNWPLEVIRRQIDYSREKGVHGNAFYRADYLLKNRKGITTLLQDSYYATPALLPSLTWLSDTIPPAPAATEAVREEAGKIRISWPGDQTDLFYNIYRSENFPVDTESSDNLLVSRLNENCYLLPDDDPEVKGYYYIVTAYDRFHNESPPSDAVYFVSGEIEK